jgi:hypothetical protein
METGGKPKAGFAPFPQALEVRPEFPHFPQSDGTGGAGGFPSFALRKVSIFSAKDRIRLALTMLYLSKTACVLCR